MIRSSSPDRTASYKYSKIPTLSNLATNFAYLVSLSALSIIKFKNFIKLNRKTESFIFKPSTNELYGWDYWSRAKLLAALSIASKVLPVLVTRVKNN